MRKYIVYYYAEKNDECMDCEMEIEAPNIVSCFFAFEDKVKVYSRIFRVEEKIGNSIIDIQKVHWNFEEQKWNLIKSSSIPLNKCYYMPKEVHYIDPNLNFIVRFGCYVNRKIKKLKFLWRQL